MDNNKPLHISAEVKFEILVYVIKPVHRDVLHEVNVAD